MGSLNSLNINASSFILADDMLPLPRIVAHRAALQQARSASLPKFVKWTLARFAMHVVESVTATHCLDAYTVIAYLRNEAGAEVLKALIKRLTTFLAMHVCNLGEVYYDFFRADGLTAAQTAWTNTVALPLLLRRDAADAFVPRSGSLK